jgi:hypothetical protein
MPQFQWDLRIKTVLDDSERAAVYECLRDFDPESGRDPTAVVALVNEFRLVEELQEAEAEGLLVLGKCPGEKTGAAGEEVEDLWAGRLVEATDAERGVDDVGEFFGEISGRFGIRGSERFETVVDDGECSGNDGLAVGVVEAEERGGRKGPGWEHVTGADRRHFLTGIGTIGENSGVKWLECGSPYANMAV